MPRRALPPRARCARRRVLHPGRVEGRAPASVVVLSQLKIEALAVHPDGDVADAGPGVEPGAESRRARSRGARRSPANPEGAERAAVGCSSALCGRARSVSLRCVSHVVPVAVETLAVDAHGVRWLGVDDHVNERIVQAFDAKHTRTSCRRVAVKGRFFGSWEPGIAISHRPLNRIVHQPAQ